MNGYRILAKAISAALLVAGTVLSLAVLFHPLGSGPGLSPSRVDAATPAAAAYARYPVELERITVLTDDSGRLRVYRDGIEVEDPAQRAGLAMLASKHLERLVALRAGTATPLPDRAGPRPTPSL